MLGVLLLAVVWSDPAAFRLKAEATRAKTEATWAKIDRLEVELVPVTRVTDAEIEAIRDQIVRIWRQAGIEVAWVVTQNASEAGQGRLRVILTSGRVRGGPASPGLCDLGLTRFTGGIPARDLVVSVGASRTLVREARPELPEAVRTLVAARIAGRAAAHEIGHYLLTDTGHRPEGLMRARFDGAELLGPNLSAFSPPRRPDIDDGLTRALSSSER